MRMFLICMCDIFLILYLTGLTNVQQHNTVFTVKDFYELKTMHETLKEDKEKIEESLKEKLRFEKEEKERLLAEQKKQEELAAARVNDLSSEKEELEAKLAEETKKVQEVENSLVLSDAERKRIQENLQDKEKMLKEREQLLAKLNDEIAAKEEARKKMESAYQKDLNSQQQEIEKNRSLAQQLKGEALNAQQLADQMKKEAAQATKAADIARVVQQKALVLKEEAIKDKEAAEKKSAEALAARIEAEEEKKKALEAMEAANIKKKLAEEKAEELAGTIEDITQEGETAYTNNIVPQVQILNVKYARSVSDQTFRYERELTLMPIKIDGSTFVILPSSQIGFTTRSDRAPDELAIMYKGKKITHGLINKQDNLIAIELSGYKGQAKTPYPADKPMDDLMPTLLAVRNNGNMGLIDKIRGLADNYFIVNRDYLESDKDNSIGYDVKGFRGTGMRGERIVLGDQLIDLNGQLIGIANDTNHILRINTLSGWVKLDL